MLKVKNQTIHFTELGSSFTTHLSKSLDVHGGVWPQVSGMSPTNERKRTISLTNSIANTFGGSSGSGAPPTEKECRQVFFDCALWENCAAKEWVMWVFVILIIQEENRNNLNLSFIIYIYTLPTLPHIKIIFRNTPMGYSFCSQFSCSRAALLWSCPW